MTHDRIPTKINLIRRGINIGNSSCNFCRMGAENTEHLLCRCSFTYGVWTAILDWFGLKSVVAGDPKSLFLQFSGLIPKNGKKPDFLAIWFFTIWTMWLRRDKLAFNANNTEQALIQYMVDKIKAQSWSWFKAKNQAFVYGFVEWCSSPLFCTF